MSIFGTSKKKFHFKETNWTCERLYIMLERRFKGGKFGESTGGMLIDEILTEPARYPITKECRLKLETLLSVETQRLIYGLTIRGPLAWSQVRGKSLSELYGLTDRLRL